MHYAGQVTYTVDGFLDKNKDKLVTDLEACMLHSGDPFISGILFAPDAEDAAATHAHAKKKSKTQAGQFRSQLRQLMATLNKTEPQYIRCIKANNQKAPSIFDGPLCYQQLRFSGVFEAVTIRQQGFPFRFTHRMFFQEYRCCAPDACPGIKQPDYKVTRAKLRCPCCSLRYLQTLLPLL